MPGDLPFLERLFRSWKGGELGLDHLPPALAAPLLAQQWGVHRTGAAVGVERWVVEAEGGPIGALTIERAPGRVHVAEFALLPDWRRRGIGTALLGEEIRGAAAQGCAVTAMVFRFNQPALAFWRRLGFTVAEDGGTHLRMARSCATPATAR